MLKMENPLFQWGGSDIFFSMLLFLLFFTPLVYLFYMYEQFSSVFSRKERCLSLVVGLLALFASGVFCGFCSLFVFLSRYTGSSFSAYLFSRWFSFIVVPCVIFFGLFVLFSKDSLQVRLSRFLEFTLPFYIIYLPFEVITRLDTPSVFQIFFVPTLAITDCFVLSVFLKTGGRFFAESRVKAAACLIAGLILSIIPFALEALWYYQGAFVLWFLPALLYALLPVFAVLKKKNWSLKSLFSR